MRGHRAFWSFVSLGICCMLPPALPRAQSPLSASEQRIVAAIDAETARALDLLERVVDINSGTMNLSGVRRVGDVFAEEFDGLGFRTRWIDGSAFNRAGHLLAERPGPGPHLLLIGHLDTVFEADSPFQRFERVSPTEARGPGIIDMKGGDVIIVQVLSALDAAGALDAMHVTVILTGDEEDEGRPADLARAALIDAAKTAQVAIGFENGDNDPRTALTARRGFTGWEVDVAGTPAHSSQVFTEPVGAGAAYELSRVLAGFYTSLSGEGLLSLNPGLILGGTTVEHDVEQSRGTAFGKTNVVAGRAIATGELRTISRAQLEAATATMRDIAARSLPRTTSRLTFHQGKPPMAASDGNRALLRLYSQVSVDLGLGEVTATDPRSAGAADIAYAADHVRMALDGLGLLGRADHTVNETADLNTLATQARRAALLMHRLTQKGLP
jgi:glutamate carboxypeptidase